jgi:outer membrane protein W
MRHRIRGGAAKVWLVGAGLALAAAVPVGAQGTGNGYLFGEPMGRVTLRAGYAHAMANSDIFDENTKNLTLDKSDFSGPTFGGEAAFRIAPRIDFTLDAAYAGVKRNSSYRDLTETDANGNEVPIRQTTTFQRIPLTANLRLYLADRGRSVGSLAWIPAKVVPWVGAGAGVSWFRFKQEGDFVTLSDPNLPILTTSAKADGWGPALQGMGGVDVTITPRIALTGDARYIWSRATLGDSYEGFDKIDLSGVSVALGLTFRL